MTITRSAKAGGGTDINDGQIAVGDDVNVDMNTVFTEVNDLRTDVTSLQAIGVSFIDLRIEAATLPDASGTINNPPELVREISSGTQTTNAPKVTQTVAKFDDTTDEHLCWAFILPAGYTSGGTLRLIWKAATATSGACYWKGSIAVATDSSADDDALVFNTVTGVSSTAPATQGQTLTATITLTTTNMLVNRKAVVFIGRDADGTLATDDMTGDAILCAARFEYA